jgi:galactoside O-acetyltransferase
VLREYVRVHPSTIIAPNATVTIVNPPQPPCVCLDIDEGCHVYSTFTLLRPAARISIGKRCQLGASHFVCAERIEVSDDVLMAWGATIADTDNHSIYWDERSGDVERCRRDYVATGGADLARTHDWTTARIAPVHIGPKSWIGFNVIILRGVTIGEGAVIGAGSVVTRNVGPWRSAAGNPCRELRLLPQRREEQT